MDLLGELGITVALILLGFFAGRQAERSHYRSIKKRERELLHVPAIADQDIAFDKPITESTLALGSVVVSIDYYKRFLAKLVNLFGGEVTPYSSLLDRARREAILRMKADHANADAIVNCRVITSTIASSAGQSMGCVEVLAYGTAVVLKKD